MNGDLMREREEMFARVTAHPLFIQYVQHLNHSQPASNTEPWHALGERLSAAGLCLLGVDDEKVQLIGPDPAMRGEMLLDAAKWILDAPAYLWTQAIEHLADAAPLPKHVISPSVLRVPAMFWSREGRNIGVEDGGTVETNWLALRSHPKGLQVLHDIVRTEQGSRKVKEMGVSSIEMLYGHCWPTDFEKWDRMSQEGVARILKRCAFLSSPYINTEEVCLARHHRRQMERDGVPPDKVQEPISVVKLRHEVKQRVAQHTQETSSVEWQHHWWVDGHYRAQWYPAEEAHKVIWIAPYLKGPMDKPLLEKVYAVVR